MKLKGLDMQDSLELLERLASTRQTLLEQMHKVIVGQERVIDEVLIALFSGGHCLVEGVPGLAKTLLVNTLARITHLKFARIQFTPDLMPSDITGTDILTENKSGGHRSFEFIRGPLFANIILADEINRTPPKTQAALLEAMGEHQITAGGQTFKLDPPFLVLATQNPIEQEGTYPLPEAQLDRFMFMINIDYPSEEEERSIVRETTGANVPNVQPVLNAEDILACQRAIRDIPVADHVLSYAVRLVRATRPQSSQAPESIRKWVNWGAGPRASQYLVLAAKARAALDGRLAPSEDDVRRMATIVLQHRVIVSFAAEAEGLHARDVVAKLLEEVQPEG
ncbi:MAG: MoxR family ATPase [Candidatus Cloacimonetes bacterium]|nr:MoxR family ATPase [Candidatus Cloacimonadota bacterium]